MNGLLLLFTTFCLCLLLVFCPESVWNYGLTSIEELKKNIFKQWGQRFESSAKKGLRLMNELYKLERQIYAGKREQKYELPHYKHYSAFIHELLELNRTLGIPLREALLMLKQNLKKEQQFSRQWDSLCFGGLAQILLLFLVSWVFFESSRRILEQNVQWGFSLVLLLIQLCGLGLYLLFIKRLNTGPMQSLRVLEKILQQLLILKLSGLSSHKIYQLLKLEQCDHLHASQADLKNQLIEMIVAWRESGIQLESQCRGMLEEIEFRQELYRQKALTLEKGVRFLIFALFFVVPYFLYLGGLMTSLFH